VRRTHGLWFAVRCGSVAGLVVAVAVLAIAAQGARAAFPGANGRIAFTVSEMQLVLGQHPGYVETVWSKIETVLPSGRGRRSLRVCPAGGCLPSDPAWSPDGERLAFFTENHGPLLWIINHNGTGLRQIKISSPSVSLSIEAEAGWSPDGRRLVFVGGVLPVLTPQLFTVGIDGNGLRQVTSLCSDEPSWSVTGTIAFRGACQAPATGIYTIRPNGSRLQHVLNNRYWPPTYPDWSPDGTQMAYTGAVSDAKSDIYVANAHGKRARQLTHHGGAQPAWSPDGKNIAFVGNNGLDVMRRDGRSLRRIVSIPPHSLTSTKWLVIGSPSWQPLPR